LDACTLRFELHDVRALAYAIPESCGGALRHASSSVRWCTDLPDVKRTIHSSTTGARTMENQMNASTKLAEAKDKFSRDIGGVVDEATDLLKDFGTRKLQAAKHTLAHAQTVVTDGAKHYASTTDGYVRANPWTALGVAAGAGLLMGILLARR
jgi:ElaB/YqjD/DUF883 family membrane-anchored ribosome-binding protein